jgi:hypothetical protein
LLTAEDCPRILCSQLLLLKLESRVIARGVLRDEHLKLCLQACH